MFFHTKYNNFSHPTNNKNIFQCNIKINIRLMKWKIPQEVARSGMNIYVFKMETYRWRRHVHHALNIFQSSICSNWLYWFDSTQLNLLYSTWLDWFNLTWITKFDLIVGLDWSDLTWLIRFDLIDSTLIDYLESTTTDWINLTWLTQLYIIDSTWLGWLDFELWIKNTHIKVI